MFNTLLGAGALRVMELSLRGLAERQKAITANIANVDTPSYKALRFNFQRYMNDALTRGALAPARYVRAETGSSQRLDGNNVDLEREVVMLAENSLHYQAVLDQVGRKLGLLRTIVKKS